ncbi:MAG: 4-hydroxy-tetrahydrodipicolinate synthase [Armatimonadota bacterium]|nr:MAG: 4-hydroxy-tetrahydrodipicolinate synthase [Armatimonadota bacterium]
MARARFSGIYIPIVTPFNQANDFDAQTMAALIDRFIAAGVNGIAPCGTTGESATLSYDEHRQVIEATVRAAAKRGAVIAGTGSNSTAEAIALTQHAERVGADAALVICPYYNRPTQQGLVEHFRAVADATSLPMIMYNIPKRTGVNMEAATTIELSRVPNIVGVKEASGDLEQIMHIIAGTEDFTVLTGDDALLYPLGALAAHGGIMAAAHIATEQWVKLWRHVEAGELPEARKLHYHLLPLVKALFYETNPTPVKAALEMLGIPVGNPRSPLLPATEGCRQALTRELGRLGLLPGGGRESGA